jgi:hypothetical protein
VNKPYRNNSMIGGIRVAAGCATRGSLMARDHASPAFDRTRIEVRDPAHGQPNLAHGGQCAPTDHLSVITPHRPARQTIATILIALVVIGALVASGRSGEDLGMVGLVLMLTTEIRDALAVRGWAVEPLRRGLPWHWVIGMIGACLVLWATGWPVHGLDGAITLMTIVVMISSFVGHYLSRAIPRTVAGAAVTLTELEAQLEAGASRLAILTRTRAEPGSPATRRRRPPLSATPGGPLSSVIAYPLIGWYDRATRRRAVDPLASHDQATRTELHRLIGVRHRVLRQIERLDTSHSLFTRWRTLHIPLGIIFGVVACVQIGTTIFPTSFLH